MILARGAERRTRQRCTAITGLLHIPASFRRSIGISSLSFLRLSLARLPRRLSRPCSYLFSYSSSHLRIRSAVPELSAPILAGYVRPCSSGPSIDTITVSDCRYTYTWCTCAAVLLRIPSTNSSWWTCPRFGPMCVRGQSYSITYLGSDTNERAHSPAKVPTFGALLFRLICRRSFRDDIRLGHAARERPRFLLTVEERCSLDKVDAQRQERKREGERGGSTQRTRESHFRSTSSCPSIYRIMFKRQMMMERIVDTASRCIIRKSVLISNPA